MSGKMKSDGLTKTVKKTLEQLKKVKSTFKVKSVKLRQTGVRG